MKKSTGMILLGLAAAITGCAEFPEKYENVIEGGKVRPFAIIVDPPEAAPGDTVRVELKMYDGGKAFAVDWELALKYRLNQGATSSAFPTASEIIDLEAEGRKLAGSQDGLSFSFVIPNGAQNPLRLTELSPEILKSEGDMSPDEKEELAKLGLASFPGGLKKEDLVGALDTTRHISNKLAPLVDGLIGLMQFKAKVAATGFKLDVTKNLTVRYSNRIDDGPHISNVNRNPVIDSIGFIDVEASGITHFSDIAGHKADTVFFATRSQNAPPDTALDTLRISPGHSYFLIASGRDAEQPYRSPAGLIHKEQLYYQWFYTNLDPGETAWENLIILDNGDRPADLPVVPVKFPKQSAGLKRFAIRATVGDIRPEWGALVSAGLDYKSIFANLIYE